MSSLPQFDQEEVRILNRINHYFGTVQMSMKEKAMIAHIIAQHELDSEQYGSETEYQAVLGFQRILEALIKKL
ncbi:MAG TPA: hypothetical protein VN426_13835 [Syntrophomonadaceae bacterium]|nr:hypothetical protein [Syntrophomonadaceae bacterium]